MKKTLLSILLSICFLFANSQVLNSKFVTINKENDLVKSFSKYQRQLPPFWNSDFSNPSDWVFNNSGQTSPNGWSIGAVVNSWYNGLSSGIQSTSGGNFAELYNGDPTQNTQMLNVTYTMTIANSIDVLSLAGTDEVTLSWEETGARFNDLQEVQVSTDGVNFVTIADNLSYNVLSQSGGSMYSNPEIRTVNIQPYISSNPSNVWIRYSWTTNFPTSAANPNVWITYGWLIDDVSLSVTPDYLMNSVDANHGGWEVGYANTTGFGMDYTIKPLTQSAANPYMFELSLSNLGAKNLSGSKMNVSVNSSIGVPIFSSSSDTTTISVLDTVTFLANQNFDPGVVGVYDMFFWGTSSNANSDTITMQAVISDSVYARDYGTPDGSWRVGRSCGGLQLLNVFDIYDNEQVSSASAHIADYSIPGTEVYAILYEVDTTQSPWAFIQLAQTDDYNLQAQDIDNWINLAFKPAYSIFPGPHAIAIGGYPHPLDTFGVSTSGDAEILMSRIQDNGCNLGSQAFGYWYYISNTPMIRMNFGSTWPQSTEFKSQNIFEVYPNPVKNTLNIQFRDALKCKYSLELFDITGRLVFEKRIENNLTNSFDVGHLEKGNYMLHVSNKNYSTKTKITIK